MLREGDFAPQNSPPEQPKRGGGGEGAPSTTGTAESSEQQQCPPTEGGSGRSRATVWTCPPRGGTFCRGAKTSVSRVILSSQGQRQISGGITQTAIEVPNGSVTPGRSAQRGTSVSYNPGESELKEHGMRRKPGTKSMTARRSRHAMRSDTRPVSPNDP